MCPANKYHVVCHVVYHVVYHAISLFCAINPLVYTCIRPILMTTILSPRPPPPPPPPAVSLPFPANLVLYRGVYSTLYID